MAFAAKQAKGDIADDQMDNRALWMFADRALAPAIREVWQAYPSRDLRFDLARLIREGGIAECADLASELALDQTAGDYHRAVAMDALAGWDDKKTLAAIAKDLVENAAQSRPRFAVEAAKTLFPNYLTVPQLFTIIEHVPSPKPHSGDGFGYALSDLLEACPTPRRATRLRLAWRSFACPSPSPRLTREFPLGIAGSAKHLAPIAKRLVGELGDGDPPTSLIRLLMAVERAEREYNSDDDPPSLLELVSRKSKIQRALLWGDVAEQRVHGGDDNHPTHHWEIMMFGASLWQFGERDLPWLYEDLAARQAEADQRIVLSAVVDVLRRAGRFDAELPHLKALIADKSHLEADMAAYLAPSPPPSAEMRRHEKPWRSANAGKSKRTQRPRKAGGSSSKSSVLILDNSATQHRLKAGRQEHTGSGI